MLLSMGVSQYITLQRKDPIGEDNFGHISSPKPEVTNVEDDESGNDCVICLSELRNIDVLPCQHMILQFFVNTCNSMVDKELDKILLETENKVVSIFTQFMLRIAKLDELVDAGKRFLMGFNQELGYFRRPQINKDSKVVNDIIKSNMTERMKSYLDAGCTHSHHNIQNLSQLHNCMLGLQDFLKKAKASLDEIECLAEDAYKAVIESEQNTSRFLQGHVDEPLMNQTASPEDEAEAFDVKEKSVSYATMMTIIYNMLKLDYTIQEKIVWSLSLNTSLSELETYCQMWDLRPYVDDDTMHHAWKSVPR